MLLMLPPDVCGHVLTFVTGRSDEHRLSLKQNVLSSCKALRGTLEEKKSRHPTHAQQARMLKECYSFEYEIPFVPFDTPFLLELCRAWEAPHTRRALVHWVQNQRGLFARLPWRCRVFNAKGVECFRIRVKLWDRVSYICDRYGDTRKAWRLVRGLQYSAYHTTYQPSFDGPSKPTPAKKSSP